MKEIVKRKVIPSLVVLLLFTLSMINIVYLVNGQENEYTSIKNSVDEAYDYNFESLSVSSLANNREIRTSNETIRSTADYGLIKINVIPESNEPTFDITIKNNIESAKVLGDSIVGKSVSEINEVINLFDGGFRKHFVITSRSSDEVIDCGINPPQGYKFKFSEDALGNKDGSIELVNKDNHPILALNRPWAKDSNGVEIKTEYIIKDNRVYQIVNHKSANYKYPIVADPTAQYNRWFSGTKWIKLSGGWTLSVAPSKALLNDLNARKGSMTASVTNTSWNALYNQNKLSNHWRNTPGMRDQYKCHVYNAQLKNRWNLDTWRPNVGYTKTVLNGCNP